MRNLSTDTSRARAAIDGYISCKTYVAIIDPPEGSHLLVFSFLKKEELQVWAKESANATVSSKWWITTHLGQQRQGFPIAQFLVLLVSLLVSLLLLLLSCEHLTKELIECGEEVLRRRDWDE